VWPGEVNFYSLQSLDCYTPGIYDKLLMPNAEEFTITKKDQTVYRFSKILTSPLNNTYLLTSITDQNSNQVTLQYNNNGRLKWAKSPGNKYITFSYYPETESLKKGLIQYVKDSLALNRVLQYQYDSDRNLTGFIDAMGHTTSYTYDTTSRFDHFLTSITYPDGSTVSNTFDPNSKRLTAQSTISGSPETNVQISNPSPNHVSITDEIGNSIGMQFNDLGNISQLTSANGNASFEFNNPNNPTKPTNITDGMGFRTTISYDDKGNPLTIHKPQGVDYQYQWSSTNDLTLFTNPLNKQTHYSYTNGNLTSVQTPRGTSIMSYLPNGNITSFTNPLGQIQNYTYDAMNNLQTISDALGNTTTYDYDLAGRITSTTDAEGNTTNYSYFNNNLLANSTDALGRVTQYSYDLFGKLLGVTDARNHTTLMAYNDSTGLLAQMTDQIGNTAHYQYYDNGLQKSILLALL
jgi:YD repeat-containing protein